jgi:hypothetical protein
MNAEDRDWDSLSTLWRAPGDAIDRTPLERMLVSHRRRLAAVAAGETVTLAFFAWLSWLVARDGLAAWEAVWLATLWAFAAIAAGFAAWNRRGAWNAMGLSVAEYRRRRALRHTRSLRFGIVLFVAEAAVVGAQLAWFERFTAPVALVLVALAAGLGAWCVWMKRRIAAEIARAAEET